MELKYIWIKQFNSIEHLGVNLSHAGNHQFSYENQSLKLIANRKSVLDFGKSISSVTAIAGQNGSGKSSICEIILRAMATLTDGSFSYREFKGIVCFDSYVFCHQSVTIKNIKSLERGGYKVIQYKESPLESFLSDLKSDLRLLGFMYYSNVIDWRSGMHEHNLSNISTQYQIHNDVFYGPHFSFHDQNGKVNNDTYNKEITNLMTGYYYEESFRNVSFYVNFPDLIPFESPESITLTLGYSGNNKWISRRKDIVYTNSFENYEQTIFENIYYNSYPDPTKVSQEQSIDILLIRNAARWLYRHSLAISYMNDNKKSTTYLSDFVFDNKHAREIFGEKIEIAQALISAIDELVSSGRFNTTFNPQTLSYWSAGGDWRADIFNRIEVQNSTKNRELVKLVISLENKLLNYEDRSIKRLSDYELSPRPSAGSYSFLSLFSRIYEAVQWNQLGHYDRKWFLLFIDEGEINFHPAWKQKLLKWVIDFLNMPFHDYKFQVIFTTHSSYLLSDLTRDNVILIRRKGDKTEIVPGDTYQTFATNIHELLATSFFMEDGFIGEFAQKTIESLIEFLQGNETKQEWSKSKALSMINAVGDEIVRQRLLDLYEQRFGPTEGSLKDELTELELRVKEIKKRLR